jgi:FtsP/CotA-like multicopper oxidase with cupredoxin domain
VTNQNITAVNGQIPMPTLTFTEGDIAEIYVHNEQKKVPLHWHSYFFTNKEMAFLIY